MSSDLLVWDWLKVLSEGEIIPGVNVPGVGTPQLLEEEWPTRKQPRTETVRSFLMGGGRSGELSVLEATEENVP